VPPPPNWLPDGRIICSQQTDGFIELWTMTADGSNPAVLMPHAEDAIEHYERRYPEWQPGE
jgi:hypothetical protein